MIAASTMQIISHCKGTVGEVTSPIAQGFECNSGNNDYFLSIDEIREYNSKVGV